MKIVKKIILTILSISMLVTAGPATAYASSSNKNISINESELEKTLSIMEQTPDYLLNNEEELEKYLNENNIYFVDNEKEANEFLSPRTDMVVPYWSWRDTKCIAAISMFIGGAGAAISGAKKLVKAAGGARALASALVTYFKTGKNPSFIKNQPSLWSMFKSFAASVFAVDSLENCLIIAE